MFDLSKMFNNFKGIFIHYLRQLPGIFLLTLCCTLLLSILAYCSITILNFDFAMALAVAYVFIFFIMYDKFLQDDESNSC